MSKKNYPSLQDFDQSLPLPLALIRSFNHGVEFAKHIIPSEDGLGLAHLFYTAADFQALYGHAPILKPHPGGVFAGTALEQRNRQVELDEYEAHNHAALYVTMEVYRTWPASIKRLREDENDTLHYCPLYVHYAALRLALPVSEADITKLKSAVSKPYSRSDIIDAFLKDQQNNIARLAANQHALNTSQAVELMMSAFTSTMQDRLDFQPFLDKFVMDNPLPAARTPAAFALAMGIYATNVLPHFVAQNSVRVAKAAAEIQTAHPMTAADQLELLALRAEKASGKLIPVIKHKAKQPVVPAAIAPRAPRQLTAGAPPFYCWTHACDFSLSYPHYSHECKARDTGHKRMATLANQMGGKPA